MERAPVEQPIDPLANRHPPTGVLSLDPLGAAELSGQRLPSSKLLDLGLPAHPPSIFTGR
jgi:hypothetical protein